MPSAGYPTGRWRLIITGAGDGALNMAVDEAILEAVSVGASPPTLRFYQWQPPCLSLGYRQPSSVVDQERCAAAGWDVVRRPTGGRAILHSDELTYSVIAPAGEPRVRGTVLESYRRISKALLTGLRTIGLTSFEAPRDPSVSGTDGPACFDGPSSYEITHAGRKLVGSAQVRKKNVILQHGTLPLEGDVGRVADALRFDEPEKRAQMAAELQLKATTLTTALGRNVTFDEVTDALIAGFTESLNLALEEGVLSDSEMASAYELRGEKHANPAWVLRL